MNIKILQYEFIVHFNKYKYIYDNDKTKKCRYTFGYLKNTKAHKFMMNYTYMIIIKIKRTYKQKNLKYP